MSLFEASLRTDKAKLSYFAGIVRFLETGSIDEGLEAIEKEAKRNGAWKIAQAGFVLDFLIGLKKSLKL